MIFLEGKNERMRERKERETGRKKEGEKEEKKKGEKEMLPEDDMVEFAVVVLLLLTARFKLNWIALDIGMQGKHSDSMSIASE